MGPESPEGRPYPVSLVWDEASDGHSGWVAAVDMLPGCVSQGETPEQAVANLTEVTRGWIEVAQRRGTPVPEPRNTDDYSGRFLVRAPRSLHERLVQEADADGVSLNQFVTNALAAAVGWRVQGTSGGGSLSATSRPGLPDLGDISEGAGFVELQSGERIGVVSVSKHSFGGQLTPSGEGEFHLQILPILTHAADDEISLNWDEEDDLTLKFLDVTGPEPKEAEPSRSASGRGGKRTRRGKT